MDKFEVPVPSQEKVGRILTWCGIGAAVIFGGNLLLPYANTFLGLLQTALSSSINIAFLSVGLVLTLYVITLFAPILKQAVDLLAQRATWALVNFDPVGHLRIWLDEVQQDKQGFATQLEKLDAVRSTVEASRDAAKEESEKAQRKYSGGLNQGRSREEVAAFSVAAGKYADSAQRYEKMLSPLTTLQQELKKLYAVYEREEFNLRTDIDIQSKEWEVAQRAGAALDSAFRFLTKKSKKQMFAEQASKVISDRYAGQFGRLRTLKDMSKDLIASFDIETGEYDAIAYEKWKQQTALVIDNRSGELEAVPVARINNAREVPRF